MPIITYGGAKYQTFARHENDWFVKLNWLVKFYPYCFFTDRRLLTIRPLMAWVTPPCVWILGNTKWDTNCKFCRIFVSLSLQYLNGMEIQFKISHCLCINILFIALQFWIQIKICDTVAVTDEEYLHCRGFVDFCFITLHTHTHTHTHYTTVFLNRLRLLKKHPM